LTSARRTVVVWGVILFLCLVWGSTWLAIKINIQDLPPLRAAGLRFLLAALVIAVTSGRRRLPRAERPGPVFWIALGFLMVACPYACVYWGEQFIPSGLTAVIFATYPLFVAVLAHVGIKGERMTATLLAGLAAGFLGVIVLFSADLAPGPASAPPFWVLGGLVVLVSAVCSAISTVLVKRRLAHLDPFLINLPPMLFGGLMLMAASLLLESSVPWRWNGQVLAVLLYLSVFGSVLTFGAYYWLMRTIPVARLSFIVYVTPIVALSLGTWIGNEPFTPHIAAGTALVIGGIALARHRPGARRLRRASPVPPGGPPGS
jgi:drug/metabolite transporter (DMT)-like permease